jgi:hypothetical protein
MTKPELSEDYGEINADVGKIDPVPLKSHFKSFEEYNEMYNQSVSHPDVFWKKVPQIN